VTPPAASNGGGAHERWQMVASVVARVRLRTATKAFCNCAVAPGAVEPNAHTCAVCLGLPGALPVLNERAVEQGVRAALALGCAVAPVSVFSRRHEFAPQVPKGYRVTQHDRPVATRGFVQIGETPEGAPLTVRVTTVRFDEEAGRATRGRVAGATGLDFNLAGAPLLRVASAPTMHSAAEVVAFVRALRRLVRAAGAGDARLGDGSLRVRVRVSVRRLGDTALGTPCNVVGAASLPALRSALDQEFARQREIAAGGGTVEPRTMLWDGAGALTAARSRRPDHDPRHLAEPDLPPLVLTSDWIAAQGAGLPSFPTARREHLAREYQLDAPVLDLLTADPELADYYEAAARRHGDPRATADWVAGPVLAAIDDAGDLETFILRVRPADLAELLDMIRDGRLGSAGARHVFAAMARTGDPPARAIRRDPALAAART
jgi:aspartyl-tRNA(Asn)/glutamyl-tRNA(Gln) amidotransferase subunit B